MTIPKQAGIRNRLLAALSPSEFEAIAIKLKSVTLDLGEPLHEAGDIIEDVYFPETGFISALAVLSDGYHLEIGLIGAEGCAGISVVLGSATSYSEAMCQTGGTAWKMSAANLIQAAAEYPHFRNLLLRYVEWFHIQVAQTAACNAHHELGQRLARWLLSAHDRSGVENLSLTQDLIAIMLGVRRSTVSVAAGQLQRAGIIRYQHGLITIIDRISLENAACECYEAVSGEYRRLFGEHPKDLPTLPVAA